MRTVLPSIAAFALMSAAVAQTNPPYFSIDPPERYTSGDKVEVVEVFSYGCIHCANFQPLIDAWRARLDTRKVEFAYLPSPYRAADTALARGFFAAQSLGLVEKTHHAMFQAIHGRGIRIQTADDVVALYAQLGVRADTFAKAMQDFFVDAQVRRAYELMLKYKIDGTPSLIVAGKYRITAYSAGSPEAMIRVADQLVSRELKAMEAKPQTAPSSSTGTSRQAPSKGK